MGKNQLHQLLAVEQDRRGRATEILQETVTLFTKKEEHLDGVVKIYKPIDDKGEPLPPEIKEVVETVAGKIYYASGFIVQAIDAQLSKEETNASGEARAELIVNGTTLGAFSATSLLALEQHLQKLLGMYRVIPTLDPVKRWGKDGSEKNIYVSEMDTKFRTNKVEEIVVAVPPTKEHPAQVVKLTKDVQVGTWETTCKSGRITPAQKSDLLGRIDSLIDAVKQARSKANEADVKQIKVGKSIIDFINQGIL